LTSPGSVTSTRFDTASVMSRKFSLTSPAAAILTLYSPTICFMRASIRPIEARPRPVTAASITSTRANASPRRAPILRFENDMLFP
jgi:hypothetical protein